jgi:hypothetical protein
MSSSLRALIVAAIGAYGCSSGTEPPASAAQSEAPWQSLLDGTSLDGWAAVGDANWQAVGGAVQADTGTGFLVSAAAYEDFDLIVEFWVTPDANSGVFLRCTNPAQPGAASCYEVNIFDQRPDPAYRTGGIVDVAKPSVSLDTGNRWNTYEISARGEHLVVKLNGQITVDTRDGKFVAGPIALQYGTGRVMFRSVRVRTG